MKTTLKTLRAAMTGLALLAATAFTANAAILVKDSFDDAKYTVGTSLKNLTPGNSTGFSSQTWGTSGSSGVFFVNDGLPLPGDFVDVASGNSIGLGKYTGANPTASKWGRRITRTIDNEVIPANGTYYVRMAMEISEDAEKFLRPKHWDGLGLTSKALVDTDGIDSFPASGLHFGFVKTGDYGSTGTTIAATGVGVSSPVTLVKEVEAGETYLLVAKVEIDSTGAASVYALAGKANDPKLRQATLPETPTFTTSVGTSALRYLCLSGVYFNSENSNRYASFDELAIGTDLGDVWGFNSADDPIVAAGEVSEVSQSGFVAAGELVQLGSIDPVVYFDLSTDEGENYTEAQVGTGAFSATGPVSFQASGLLAGSTYWWRFRAVGAGEPYVTPWQTVTLPGAPVFGVQSASVDGTSATFSVALATPGLSGEVDTTVELWIAESGSDLALKHAFDAVRAAADFSTEVADFALGGSYDYAFRATVPYNDGVLETWTETASIEIPGNVAWSGAAGTTDWGTAGNWTPQTVPNANLVASFQAVGGAVSSSADGEASELRVDTTGEGTSFNFGNNTLSAVSNFVGNAVGSSRATFGQGNYSFATTRVGGSNQRFSVMTVGNGANYSGSDIYVGYDADPAAASNSVVFASGSKTALSGTLFLRSARGTLVEIQEGASVNVGGLNLVASGATMIVDGGAFTNSGSSVIFKENRRGAVAEMTVLELRNGANTRFAGQVNIGAGINYNNQFVHGEIRVLDGATLDASGYGIFIDQTGDSGPNADSGYGAFMVVSNATVLANTISINNEDRHHDDYLLVHEDQDGTARVATTSNMRVGAASWGRSGTFNYDNRLRVESGEVSVGGTLYVGDGGQYFDRHSSNRVEIAGSNPRVSAAAMNVYGASRIEFEIPAGGYASTPLSVTGSAEFGAVPSGQDAETWVPVNEISVDATDFIGTQTLIEASSILGLSVDRVAVSAPSSTQVSVTLSGSTLSVSVMPAATLIIMR